MQDHRKGTQMTIPKFPGAKQIELTSPSTVVISGCDAQKVVEWFLALQEPVNTPFIPINEDELRLACKKYYKGSDKKED